MVKDLEYLGWPTTWRPDWIWRARAWWERTSFAVKAWHAATATLACTCAVYAVVSVAEHQWSGVVAAGLVALAGDVLNGLGLAAAKWVQWWRSVARWTGGCFACGASWARRAQFVGAHRENEPKSFRWWTWTPMPSYCPRCLRDL